jgi:hypothetical protein
MHQYIILLAQGWITFVFQSTKNKEMILNGKWYWDNSILSLENWITLFYPMRERVDIQTLWVKLHSLCLELWSEGVLTLIGNELGRMMDIDEKTQSVDTTSMAKIYVEMNLSDRLSDEIDI